ncbi:hypothetical protein POM88_038663 [Heracleum sosnowskyi]|uniref:RRM domain-containing protein n=1 Tax=Heracleum sosnowskyi TaxID=360622 RepID=A0AAD8HBH2_9APIA|nr:hypothetical protein POM88_038663 [Heracleum sosnowskyi]
MDPKTAKNGRSMSSNGREESKVCRENMGRENDKAFQLLSDTIAKDIWHLFNQGGKILDIILPRKRDKRNKSYGFVKTTTELEACSIISNLKQMKGLGRRLNMSVNKNVINVKGESLKDSRSPKIYNPGNWRGKKKFEFLEVEVDEEMEEALLGSWIGYTKEYKDVKEILKELENKGVKGVKIFKVNECKFFLDNEEDRRLPMTAWKEDVLKAYTRHLGSWIDWCYQNNDNLSVFNPLIRLEISVRQKIDDSMKILFKGKPLEIVFKEVDMNKWMENSCLAMISDSTKAVRNPLLEQSSISERNNFKVNSTIRKSHASTSTLSNKQKKHMNVSLDLNSSISRVPESILPVVDIEEGEFSEQGGGKC